LIVVYVDLPNTDCSPKDILQTNFSKVAEEFDRNVTGKSKKRFSSFSEGFLNF